MRSERESAILSPQQSETLGSTAETAVSGGSEGESDSEIIEVVEVVDVDPPSPTTNKWSLNKREVVLVGVSCIGTALVMVVMFCLVHCVRAKMRKRARRKSAIQRDWDRMHSILPRSSMWKEQIVNGSAEDTVQNDVVMDGIIDDINDEG